MCSRGMIRDQIIQYDNYESLLEFLYNQRMIDFKSGF